MPQEVAILSNQVLKKELKDETTVKNYVAMRSCIDEAYHAKN
ncbi:MAG TPA: hypothetical protein VKA95_04920 [Nitrososphaeraceae archaeon]|jgi:hypothetical protein|nr:hypothetical protein [Nitrososphaeraceae archaeon]